MTTTRTQTDVGARIAQLCRDGRNEKAIDEFYASDVVSVEASEPRPGVDRETRGLDDVLEKNRSWFEEHEVHDLKVEGPFPNGDDRFCLLFDYDVTFQPEDRRFRLREIARYRVKDGKVVREEFYYAA